MTSKKTSALWFWVPLLYNQSTYSDFARIFTHCAKISTDFARILKDFSGFSPNQKFWRCVCTPCTPASYISAKETESKETAKKWQNCVWVWHLRLVDLGISNREDPFCLAWWSLTAQEKDSRFKKFKNEGLQCSRRGCARKAFGALSDKSRQTNFNEYLDDFIMKDRTKTFWMFIGLCSALLDSMIVAFCTYFNNDRIREF